MSDVITVRAGQDTAPTKTSDGGYPELRGSRTGSLYTNPKSLHRLNQEGGLFHMQNATQLTGVAQTANTTSDTTKPFIFGSVPSTALKSVHLLLLRMRPTAVSSGQVQQVIDIVTSVAGSRTSAGTDYNTIGSNIAAAGYHNLRTGVNNSSVMDALWVGAPVCVLGTTPRNVARFTPRQLTIPVIGDWYVMRFGALAGDFITGNTVAEPVSTTVNHYAKDFGPVTVDPGSCFEVIPWAASIGGAMSWEFEMYWAED